MQHEHFIMFSLAVIIVVVTLVLQTESKQQLDGLEGPENLDLLDYNRSHRATDNTNPSSKLSFREEDVKKISFFLFNHKNQDNEAGYQLFLNDISGTLHSSPFILKADTTVLVHGFANSYQTEFPVNVKNAYLKQTKTFNLILVDWEELAAPPLFELAVKHSKVVGNVLAELLEHLIDGGYTSLAKIHLIGHSLGAHVCGVAGTQLENNYGKQVARISGLDPAILSSKNERKLDKSDALFVDVIHSSVFGIHDPIGSADFFPNSGELQPGCGIDPICSHGRSFQFYEESIYHPHKYKSCKCRHEFLGSPEISAESCKCDPSDHSTSAYMGIAAKLPDFGIFYVNTEDVL